MVVQLVFGEPIRKKLLLQVLILNYKKYFIMVPELHLLRQQTMQK